MAKSVLSGPKFNGRHQTYVPGVKEILLELKEAPSIKKIILGEINPVSPGVRKLKTRSQEGNRVELLFRDASATQVFHIISSDISETLKLIDKLEKKYQSHARKSKDKKPINHPKRPKKINRAQN